MRERERTGETGTAREREQNTGRETKQEMGGHKRAGVRGEKGQEASMGAWMCVTTAEKGLREPGGRNGFSYTGTGLCQWSPMSLLPEVREGMTSFGRWETASQVPAECWLSSQCQKSSYRPV